MPTRDLALRLMTGTTYRAAPYSRTSVPTAAERHMLNRMGCGYSRTTWTQMRSQGGAAAWFARQLTPASVAESAKANSLLSWFPRLADSPASRWTHSTANTYEAWEYARDLGNWTALRRIYSNRQVHETMVDFWNNHLHVPLDANQSWALRWDYDQTVRRHALGRFEDLLLACSLHPAMLVYLDNWKSVRNAPNENQGRELLELHTLGRTSGYTEQMVKDSAKVLSGWTVGVGSTWQATYDTGKHTTGAVQVLGFTDPNASPDGSDLTVRYLKYLAHHPATARTVARRLAVRFVSDSPSDTLVDRLATVFTDSGTDIAATLRALVASDEFVRSAGRKVRTPVDDLVATCRVLGVDALAPTSGSSFAHAIAWMPRSMLLYQWPRPDGAPETNADWASAARMLSSFRMHWLLAGGYYPSSAVRYRTPASWLPQKQIRLDRYVDHVCRMLLGRGSTSTDLKAVCQATGRRPTETVTAKHPLARWMFVRMAVVLLDSPDHMSR
jgi:uncharacterized protein (DUF1800 family)